MASYDVKYAEVQELFNKFNLFDEELGEAIERVDKRVTELVELESFKGAAAESIKRYFADHKKILERIQMLAEQLGHEYAAAYYNEFLAIPSRRLTMMRAGRERCLRARRAKCFQFDRPAWHRPTAR